MKTTDFQVYAPMVHNHPRGYAFLSTISFCVFYHLHTSTLSPPGMVPPIVIFSLLPIPNSISHPLISSKSSMSLINNNSFYALSGQNK